MKKFYTFLSFCIMLTMISFTQVDAQNTDNPWYLDMSTHMVDYTAADPAFKGYFDIDDWNFSPFFSKLTIGRGFGPAIALSTSASLAGLNKNPAESSLGNTFVDWDVTLRYKLANNYIINETSWFDPYLFFGVGLNHYDGDNNAAINGGLGMNFWFHENAAINIQSAYDNVFDNDNYLHHSIGIATRFGKSKDADGDGIADKDDECPNTPGSAATNGCPDKDGDGVADKIDKCPSTKGLIALNGCPDTDGDGIADSEDACPSEAGTKEMNGCPDSDGDGVANNIDQCPNQMGTIAMNGCPDTDGDGVADNFDNCPDVAGTIKNKGCPEVKDADKDGVADADDRCPNVAGSPDNFGCPVYEAEEIKEIEEKLQFNARSIQFESGKDVIKTSSYNILDEIVNIMNSYPGTVFSIEGHTDSQGSEATNLDLSSRRAGAVLSYFISKGISSNRLKASGYGESTPIATNSTAAGRAKNRRVEIKIE